MIAILAPGANLPIQSRDCKILLRKTEGLSYIATAMKMALLNGMTGLGLALLLGIGVLGWSGSDIGRCVAAANVSALIALLFTLFLERQPAIKQSLLKGGLRTWAVLSVLFLLPLLGLCPGLRDLKAFFILLVPLIFSTGFSLVLFGPIQDAVIRRSQKSKIKSS